MRSVPRDGARYGRLLERLPGAGSAVYRRAIAPGTEPGFLIAMKSLVRQSIALAGQGPRSAWLETLRRQFVYTGTIYELTLRARTPIGDAVVKERHYGPALQGDFEIRNTVTGDATTFRMSYTLEGACAGTPLRIVFRPRWWLELELALAEGPEASALALGPTGTPSFDQ